LSIVPEVLFVSIASPFSQRRSVSYVMPAETARLIAERAGEMWGSRATEGSDRRNTTVVVWQGRRGLLGGGAVATGSFSITWNFPVRNQASITRIDWDPTHGGTEESVRRAINDLAGWPIARGLTDR
jgi:hypothetical protein